MVEDSIFTKILKGEIPAKKLYEDEKTFVIVPIHPTAIAKVLVIPKLQVDQFFDLPDEDYKALLNTVKKVALKMNEVYKPKRVGLKVEGLDVPHVHVHVLAFDNTEQYNERENRNDPIDTNRIDQIAEKMTF